MSEISYKELRIYKYQLTKQYKFLLGGTYLYEFKAEYFNCEWTDKGSWLVIKRGYKWDGASGPTIDTDSFMRGSLVHDVLYQAIREGHLTLKDRKVADKILYRLCREDGMNRIRAWYTYRAVRMFGKSSAIKGKYDA